MVVFRKVLNRLCLLLSDFVKSRTSFLRGCLAASYASIIRNDKCSYPVHILTFSMVFWSLLLKELFIYNRRAEYSCKIQLGFGYFLSCCVILEFASSILTTANTLFCNDKPLRNCLLTYFYNTLYSALY